MHTIHLYAVSAMKRVDAAVLWTIPAALTLVLLTAACSDSTESASLASEERVAEALDAQPTPTTPDRETAAVSGAVREEVSASAGRSEDAGLAGAATTTEGNNPATPDTEAATELDEIAWAEVPGEVSYGPELDPVGLEERILRADVIARVTLASIATSTPGIYDNQGIPVTGTRYVSVSELRFDVHEYLKGSGGDTLIVELPLSITDHHYGSAEEAVEAVSAWLAERDTRWDDREAIIFLQRPVGSEGVSSQSGSSGYVFPIHRGGLRVGGYGSVYDSWTAYAIDEEYVDTYSIRSGMNRVWLPSTSAPASGVSGASGSTEARYYLEEPPSLGAGVSGVSGVSGASGQSASVSSITLSDMKSHVKAMDDLLKQGEGVDGYRECLITKRLALRRSDYQRLLAIGPGPYFDFDLHTSSGLPAGSVISEGRFFGGLRNREYSRHFFTGPDADLFLREVEDDDNDPGTGYGSDSKIKRPLPGGTYEIHNNAQSPVMFPCNFVPEPYARWNVHVSAPAGTLHEAFFDPVLDTSTSAVGADSENGVLKPSAFTDSGGATTTISRLEWKSGSVKMNVSPRAALTGQILDFIELDGTVSLSLYAADATADAASNTLSWTVSSRPWEDGDKLMLRIRKAANRPPAFATSTYAFTVREDARKWHILGSVSASDPDPGDSVVHYITDGNGAGRFILGSSSGELAVWRALDYETAPSYTLTVEAWDRKENGTATTTVQISVTDVAE